MRKIAVSLTKGGVGKTTTAVNLAAGLALAGYRVLLVDTDTQGHAAFMLGIQTDAGLAELIMEDATPKETIVKAKKDLWILSGGKSLTKVKRMIDQNDAEGEQVLNRTLSFLDDAYDYAIIDTSPGWDNIIINVLFFADEVLAPVSLEAITLKGLAEFSDSLDDIRQYNPISLKYILPTFLDGRVKKSEEVYQLLQTHYGSRLCTPIRYNVRLSEAAGHGQTIFEYAPTSSGAEDYQNLVERMMKNGKA